MGFFVIFPYNESFKPFYPDMRKAIGLQHFCNINARSMGSPAFIRFQKFHCPQSPVLPENVLLLLLGSSIAMQCTSFAKIVLVKI